MPNLYHSYDIPDALFERSERILEDLRPTFERLERIKEKRQLDVLKAFQDNYFCESELHGSTGYGYDDRGRDKLEAVLAQSMGAEAAYMRWQFASGTQVLYQMLRALLKPGDELLIVSGEVYDSLKPSVGASDTPAPGNLPELGVTVRYVALRDHQLDIPQIIQELRDETALVYVQKSRGYGLRPALLSEDIGRLKTALLDAGFDRPLVVDNCYGEYVEFQEPTHLGADLIAGSLIKNPGGGIASAGGYVAGRADLIERVTYGVTAPGLGAEVGPTLGGLRELALGLFMAPQTTFEALRAAMHIGALFQTLGYEVEPLPEAPRGDLVQIVTLEDSEKLCRFCEAVQAAAPIDHHFAPVPSEMPGYDCDIIMASGSFTQGSSIELSADGPLRAPYAAFFQGSLNFTSGRLAALLAAHRVGPKEQGA